MYIREEKNPVPGNRTIIFAKFVFFNFLFFKSFFFILLPLFYFFNAIDNEVFYLKVYIFYDVILQSDS